MAVLLITATAWLIKQKARRRGASEHSPWWDFIYRWPRDIHSWLENFIAGRYRFAPRVRCHFRDETPDVYNYRDRLMLSLLFQQIKPTFKHLISERCLHLKGPNGVNTALTWLQQGMREQAFRYVIRADIKSYYASIDHSILLRQTNAAFQDPRVQHYLEAIITGLIDDRAELLTRSTGIARRSPISPFLGALYLSPLDQAFANQSGVFYLRYMDDIIILAQTKSQFIAARKKMFRVLRSLKLKLSDSKTRMGPLHQGFHFLGLDFQVQVPASQNLATKTPVMSASIHARTCRCALNQVRAPTADAVHPAHRLLA